MKLLPNLCFATSTLVQGVNMPFDIIWLINNRQLGGNPKDRSLNFKNLIGRAGRFSDEEIFDYGYVYTSKPIALSIHLNNSYELNDLSIIDNPEAAHEDTKELIDSIKNDIFDDDKNLPLSKIERLSTPSTIDKVKKFLDIIYSSDDIKHAIGGNANKPKRETASKYLKGIYESSLNRELEDGENSVFSGAIMVFFLMAQGYSFKEIGGIRFNMISDRDNPKRRFAQFLQPAEKLPKKHDTLLFFI